METQTIQNSTTSDPPLLWVAEPKFRGTFGIFSLCLSTMVISVWSAVHFDIPTHRPSKLRSFVRSVMWMLEALFCPELLLFIAFNQRANAKGVTECAQRLLSTQRHVEGPNLLAKFMPSCCGRNKQSKDSNVTVDTEKADAQDLRRHLFTMVHGFYASMGGFVFDLANEDGIVDPPTFLPAGRTRLTITSMGVRFLIEHHPSLIPDLSATSITDRTQASSLSKAILLAQITWFCTNCAARIIQHLPLSLLEVTTVAHSLCTLATYALWWSKPLNVMEPTVIREEGAREACALMTMCSPDEKYMLFGTIGIQFPAEMSAVSTLAPQHDREGQSRAANAEPVRSDSVTSNPWASQETSSHELRADASDESTLLQSDYDFATLIPGKQHLTGTTLVPRLEPHKTPYHSLKAAILFNSRSLPWYARRRDAREPVVLNQEDIIRWQLASSAMRRYGLTPETLELPEKPYVIPRSSLQASSDFKGRSVGAIIRSNLSATALTIIYGFPHFLAWNTQFPTPREQLLWRVATIAVTFWGMAMACIVALILAVRFVTHTFTGERRGEALLVSCAASMYIVTAGYLLVESLRQLLYLEPGAYKLPTWSSYLPHFS